MVKYSLLATEEVIEKSLDEIVERLVMKEPVQKDGYRAELEKTEQIDSKMDFSGHSKQIEENRVLSLLDIKSCSPLI